MQTESEIIVGSTIDVKKEKSTFSSELRMLCLILSILGSMVLYFLVPVGYDHTYAMICFVIFVSNAFLFLRNQITRVGLLNFHLFFFIGFFFMNIVYLVYIYPMDPVYFFMFQYGFNEDILCKSLIICVIGYLFYILGVSVFSNKMDRLNSFRSFSSVRVLRSKIIIALIFCAIFFILFVLIRGIDSFLGSYEDSIEAIDEASEGGLLSPIVALFQIMIFILIAYNFIEIKNNYTSFTKMIIRNKSTIILLSIILFLYFMSGSRSLLVKIILSVACLYSIYIKKISGLFFLVALVGGFFVLGILSRTREVDDKMEVVTNFTESSSAIDFAMDLIVVNRNVFLAIDEVEKNGYTYGLKASKAFFSFFPYYPVVAANLGLRQSDIESEEFFKEKTKIHYSPGSNMIGDLYMILGLPSVILGMFILGAFVAQAEKRAINSIYWLYIYISLLGASILYPRFGYFFLSRFLVWGLFVIYVFEQLNIVFKFKGVRL